MDLHLDLALLAAMVSTRTPPGDLGPWLSALAVYGGLLLGPVLIVSYAIVAARRWWKRAVEAAATYRHGAPLAPGDATLWGRVEWEEGAELAVRVEVDQRGSERETSGSWSHLWTETGRRVRVHPFHLCLPSKERVWVRPDEKVLLVDDLDGVIQTDDNRRRTRFAELSPDEEVFVSGRLTRELDAANAADYRSTPTRWVMSSPPDRPMLLSTKSLSHGFVRRHGTHQIYAWVIAIAFALYQLVAFFGYHKEVVGGLLRGQLGATVPITAVVTGFLLLLFLSWLYRRGVTRLLWHESAPVVDRGSGRLVPRDSDE